MYEEELQDYANISYKHNKNNPEIISIRKKLVAPNDILPGRMIRSKLPVHILPVEPDFYSKPGKDMPLGQFTLSQQDMTKKIKRHRTKNYMSTNIRSRVKSEFSENINKKNRDLSVEQQKKQKILDLQKLNKFQFCRGSLKGLLKYQSKIVFVSRSVLTSEYISQKDISRIKSHLSKQQIKKQYFNVLQNSSILQGIPYVYNQENLFDSLSQFPDQDQHLLFDDNFQSSNLLMSFHLDNEVDSSFSTNNQFNHHYLLTLRLDYNTRSYGQWFYFKVIRKQMPFSFSRNGSNLFKFSILNMTKNSSLFDQGLKISVCRNQVWSKQGKNIKYYKNSILKPCIKEKESQDLILNLKQPQSFYTLQFTLQICEGQQLYISYNEPYTYTRLGRFLDHFTTKYQQNNNNIINFKRNLIGTSYLNNNIQVLTFGAKQKINEDCCQKKIIFIMGRTHPIQTAGSHVIQGILNQIFTLFIQNPSKKAKQQILYKLLQQYIIKIIPMVNPDGVIVGNSRCNLNGFDLNRVWRNPKLQKCKQISYIKRYILQYQHRIDMFIDLHAHSKKKNIFAYGCHDMNNPYATRQFPFLLSKLSQKDFLFTQCRFTRMSDLKNNKISKDGTARIYLYNTLKIPNIFTIQNSYCSSKQSMYHYDSKSFSQVASDILKAISLYFSPHFKPNNKWENQKKRQKQLERVKYNQQHNSQLNVSISSNYNQVQLKLTIKSQGNNNHFEDQLCTSLHLSSMRSKYLCQLKQNDRNMTIGLIDDVQGSDSQVQQRIEQDQKLKTCHTSLSNYKKYKDSSHTEKVINYIFKNGDKAKQQKRKIPSSINLKSSINVSQTKLINVSRINKLNINKCAQVINFPFQHHNTQEGPVTTKNSPSQKTIKNPNFKRQNLLSIVQIGVFNQPNQPQYRSNLIKKLNSKQRLKSINTMRQSKKQQTNDITATYIPWAETNDDSFSYNTRIHRKKQQQIKTHFRRIMKPKQMFERRSKVPFQQIQIKKPNEFRLSTLNYQ